MPAVTPPPSFLLIDGLNVIRRCYEANPAPDSTDKARAAHRASVASIRRALVEHTPTHALMVMDSAAKSWRHARFPGYKAGRKPMPAVLREEIPAIEQTLSTTLGLRTLTMPEQEADDVLASAVTQLTQPVNLPVVVLSTDKDLCCLIQGNTRVRDHFNQVWRNGDWVVAKFGVPPRLLADLLALTGDASDGIPGAPQVGTRTASRWLSQYGSLDAVLKAARNGDADLLRTQAGRLLKDNIELVETSRELVTLDRGLPLPIQLDDCRIAA